MTSPPDFSSLDTSDKDAFIAALLARVGELWARVAELDAKLGLPLKTPRDSSTQRSHGRLAVRLDLSPFSDRLRRRAPRSLARRRLADRPPAQCRHKATMAPAMVS
jgi:hypothetical protein